MPCFQTSRIGSRLWWTAGSGQRLWRRAAWKPLPCVRTALALPTQGPEQQPVRAEQVRPAGSDVVRDPEVDQMALHLPAHRADQFPLPKERPVFVQPPFQLLQAPPRTLPARLTLDLEVAATALSTHMAEAEEHEAPRLPARAPRVLFLEPPEADQSGLLFGQLQVERPQPLLQLRAVAEGVGPCAGSRRRSRRRTGTSGTPRASCDSPGGRATDPARSGGGCCSGSARPPIPAARPRRSRLSARPRGYRCAAV